MTPESLSIAERILARFSTLDVLMGFGMYLAFRIVVSKKTNRSSDRFALAIIAGGILIAAVFRAAIWISGG